MGHLKNQIERAEKKIDLVEKVLAVMGLIEKHEDSNAFDYHFSIEYVRVQINILVDLTKARKMLRDIFGEWTDQIDNQFVSSDILYTTWHHESGKYPVEIWYGCPINDIDKELLRPGCGVIERTVKEKTYVCGLGAKHD